MISIKVSKNVDDYKENVVGTLDLKKSLAVLKGAGVGTIIMIVLSLLHVPMILACYGGLPAIGYFIYKGFYEKDGMTYEEARRLKKEHSYDGVNFPCASGNDIYTYNELISQYNKEHKAEQHIRKREDDTDFFSLFKKYVLIGGLVILACIVALVVFMMVL